MQSHACCSCHLGLYAVACEWYAVVAGFCNLLCAVGGRPQATAGYVIDATLIHHFAGHRHHGNIKKVANTGSAQVCMRETNYRSLVLMVARTPVPGLVDAGGSKLHHTERYACTHEHVSVSAAADERVYIVGQPLLFLGRLLCTGCQ